MPVYIVSHTVPLLASQRDNLADAITQIHSQLFTTPRFFVQVRFQPLDISSSSSTTQETLYIGGKQQTTGNHIVAHVRTGASRTQEDFDNLTKSIVSAWNSIVPLPVSKTTRSAASSSDAATDTALHSLLIIGGMIAGYEAGFMLPPAGGDVEWLKKNWKEIEDKAQKGEVRFVDLVNEVRERHLLGEPVDEEEIARRNAKRLEEALGWGDSA